MTLYGDNYYNLTPLELTGIKNACMMIEFEYVCDEHYHLLRPISWICDGSWDINDTIQ
jgi:hypothetical protein